MRAGRAEFERAVRAYAFDAELDADLLAHAREALRATGLVVAGEAHGLRETPAVVYALTTALGTRGLAFEWSHDELDEPVQAFMRTGRFDLDRLWSLPPSAEAFCGDGRFTAGHVALLERLHRESRLDQVVLFDRLDAAPPASFEEHVRVRDREMASRLLTEWDRSVPMLAVMGGFHAQLAADEGEPMAAHLARELPGLAPVMLPHEGTPAVTPTRSAA